MIYLSPFDKNIERYSEGRHADRERHIERMDRARESKERKEVWSISLNHGKTLMFPFTVSTDTHINICSPYVQHWDSKGSGNPFTLHIVVFVCVRVQASICVRVCTCTKDLTVVKCPEGDVLQCLAFNHLATITMFPGDQPDKLFPIFKLLLTLFWAWSASRRRVVCANGVELEQSWDCRRNITLIFSKWLCAFAISNAQCQFLLNTHS